MPVYRLVICAVLAMASSRASIKTWRSSSGQKTEHPDRRASTPRYLPRTAGEHAMCSEEPRFGMHGAIKQTNKTELKSAFPRKRKTVNLGEPPSWPHVPPSAAFRPQHTANESTIFSRVWPSLRQTLHRDHLHCVRWQLSQVIRPIFFKIQQQPCEVISDDLNTAIRGLQFGIDHSVSQLTPFSDLNL